MKESIPLQNEQQLGSKRSGEASEIETAEDASYETATVARVEQMSYRELLGFMEAEFCNDPRRHHLSQSGVNTIVWRGLELLEKDGLEAAQTYQTSETDTEKSSKWDDTPIVSQSDAVAFSYGFGQDDFTARFQGEESIRDKAFRAVGARFDKWPFAAHLVLPVLSEGGIQPDVLIDEVVDALERPQAHSSQLIDDLLSAFQYHHAFGDGSLNKLIAERLNFTDPKHYAKTTVVLELIQQLHNMSRDFRSAKVAESRLAQVLKGAVERNEGSYLLNARAKEIYTDIKKNRLRRYLDAVPIRVADGLYVVNDRLLKVRPGFEGDTEEVVRQIEAMQQRIDSEIRRYRNDTSHEFRMSKTFELQDLYEELYDYTYIMRPSKLLLESKSAREEDMADYAYLLCKPTRSRIEKDFSIDITQLSIPEQFQLLTYLKSKEAKNVASIQSFAKKYGKSGFRTFLSLEYGRELGEGIIALGEKLPKEEAEKIFAKYGELVDAANDAEAALREQFGSSAFSPEEVAVLKERLLKKGRDMLASFADEVGKSKNVGYELALEHIEKELSLLSADATLFAAAFRELSARGERPDFSEIENVKFERGVASTSFTEADRERMRELYRVNYAEYPEFQQYLLEHFNETLAEEASQFYVLRYKGVVEGFYRLGVTERDTLYFGAFNINPKYAGSGLGEALMQEALDVRAKDSIIKANCIADKPISANYIERGFIGTHTGKVKEPTLMYIIRHDSKKQLFPSKALSTEEILRTCDSSASFICMKVPFKDITPSTLDILNERASEGARAVLTRYIRDKKSATAYFVFEKVTNEALEEFSRPEHPVLET